MVYDVFIGSDLRDSKNLDAWTYSVEQNDLLSIINNILTGTDLNEREEIIIIVRPEYEGG